MLIVNYNHEVFYVLRLERILEHFLLSVSTTVTLGAIDVFNFGDDVVPKPVCPHPFPYPFTQQPD